MNSRRVPFAPACSAETKEVSSPIGCMLTTSMIQTTTCDVECRLQAAARSFQCKQVDPLLPEGASSQHGFGHCHGMTFLTYGRSAFGHSPCTQHPNHGRKFAYNTIGIWHNISQHYLGSLDQKGFGSGTRRAWARWPPWGYYARKLLSAEGLLSWQVVASTQISGSRCCQNFSQSIFPNVGCRVDR